MTQKTIIFVRHKFEPELVKWLWDQERIALKYENIPSINPDDYKKKSARDAIKRLREYCEQGVIVGASYRSYRPAELLVGQIGPGNPDELIQIERVGDYFNKVVQIRDAKIVSYRDYPILAIQPTHGTISGWNTVGKHLRAIYGGRSLEFSVESLTPGQLEVICYEYLRMAGEIDALLLPIGRGLPDIDIYGIRKSGEKVIAQVTHSTKQPTIRHKCERLGEYAGEGVSLLFFGPAEMQCSDPIIRYIAIEDVFAYLKLSDQDSAQYMMLEQMLSLNA